MEKSLLDLVFDSKAIKFAELSRTFNPFRVLGIETYEIRHANTLAWLLAPTESHGIGDTFVRHFLKIVCEAERERGGRGNEVLLRIAQSGLHSIRVRREVSSDALSRLAISQAEDALDGTSGVKGFDEAEVKKGFLDVLIEGTDWIVAVEAKVNSKQHSEQLKRYRESLEAGAPEKQKIFVFLTNDVSDHAEDPWLLLTWDALVAQPLREAMDCLPSDRQGTPQWSFLESFLEVLDENCRPPKGLREELLSQLAADYQEPLNAVAGRRHGGHLTKSERELVKIQWELFSELTRRFQAQNVPRGILLQDLISRDDRFLPLPSSTGYIRFKLKQWDGIPWMDIPKRGSYAEGAAVTCEIINDRDRGIQFKLMIRDLGVDDAHRAQRLKLLEKIQDGEQVVMRRHFPNAFTRRGRASPSNHFFGIFLSGWHSVDDAAAALKFLDEQCLPSIQEIDELIRTLG